MHTMWKGSIRFGLVTIPVKLYAATEDKDVKLRSLHKDCGTPIKYEKKCPNCDRPLESGDIVKGYEYVKGKYVILTEEDMKELKKEHEDKAVEILDFVKLEDIDPIYYNRSYFLGPGENGSKAYALLREALLKSGKIGLAEMTIRSKQQMAVVRVYKNCLVMETIHYPDEVRSADEVPSVPDSADIQEKELDTAMMLIDQMTANFDPEQYKDDYREAMLRLIQSKIDQNEGTAAPSDAPRKNVVDLMSQLQASIEKSKKNVAGKEKDPQSKAEGSPSSTGKKKRTARKKA
ncbi:Ku protein [Bacillus sp. FJAT-42376]|uniref:non-homologous end joining protein Ku n=1 Tax=Bacillus sp. FJAT-42376 TaxID=2014076 RepID=UPI000F513B03|nr:Ku protein [Bacillus sp. FJAT-42376]AZB42509.1 Ku protein [Bacillus sp. FJAT-42376]